MSLESGLLQYAGVMELVDVVDSKSTASDGVPVRVRPPAPGWSKLLLAPTFFAKRQVPFRAVRTVGRGLFLPVRSIRFTLDSRFTQFAQAVQNCQDAQHING